MSVSSMLGGVIFIWENFLEEDVCLMGAVNEARTRDPQLGKLMLYQLSYYRVSYLCCKFTIFFGSIQIYSLLTCS